jgi:hypothetical protein
VGRAVGCNGRLEVRKPGCRSGANDERLASARCGGDERRGSGDDVDAEVQAEGGAELEAKQTEALGVLSELHAELRAHDLVKKRAKPVKVKSYIGFEVDSARQVFVLRPRSARSARSARSYGAKVHRPPAEAARGTIIETRRTSRAQGI